MNSEEKNSLHVLFGKIMRQYKQITFGLIEECGIYPGHMPIFVSLLHRKDGLSQKELAEILFVTPASIAIMTKRMISAGLLERKKDDNDKRIWRVFITDKGKTLHQSVKDKVIEIEEQCFRNFTTDETVVLRRLLMQLESNLIDISKNSKNNS